MMDKQTENEPLSEEARLAEDVVQGILKTRKLFTLYPPNNPVYINASDSIVDKFRKFFETNDRLSLKIFQNEILFNNEQVYHNPEKSDNLALFFFKDGLKEITFLSSVTRNEIEEFIRILITDFEHDAPDDDIVTILWEKNFEHITYFADENFLTDVSEEEKAADNIKERVYSDDSLKKAYHDSLKAETVQPDIPVPLSTEDIQHLSSDMELQHQSKTDKFVVILFELLYNSTDLVTFKEIVRHIESALKYCVSIGDFRSASHILNVIKDDSKKRVYEDKKNIFDPIFTVINTGALIGDVGRIIENATAIEEGWFISYIKHLNETTIPHFINIMGEVQSLKGRHLVMEALSIVGQLNIKTLAEGLKNSKWHVVRDTIHILGKIGNSASIEYLAKSISHADERVRREAVKTIGSLKSPETLLYLTKALSDQSYAVRITAAKAIGNMRTKEAKKALINELTSKDFISKDFAEKKEYFGIIALWPDSEVKEFLIRTLRKRQFWKTIKNNETRACAAYALGVLRDKDALPLLQKTSRSGNKVLRENSLAAINKLTT
ncbi:MAG: HEAT repeat domain-containing protein [Nitrospirota bacterium]